jgi:nucleotide-binding universal stress UspA family protein
MSGQRAVAASVPAGEKRPVASRGTDLLVVIDGTSTSTRAVDYVATWMAGRREGVVHLVFIAPRLPARLLEFGGAEHMEREERLERELHGQQRRWVAAGDSRIAPILDAARARLEQTGIAPARIRSLVSSPLDIRTAADEVLLLAADFGCRTVVLGHHTHTWFRELANGDLTEQLVRRADGMTIWVVD